MKLFQKSCLLVLSSVFLLAGCGGSSESSQQPSSPSETIRPITPINDKTPLVPIEKPEESIPQVPIKEPVETIPWEPIKEPIETIPWEPIKPVEPSPPVLPPDNGNSPTLFHFLIMSDIHVGYSGSAKNKLMEIHPFSYSDASNDLDPVTFNVFLNKIASTWKEKEEFILLLGDTASHSGNRRTNLTKALKDLKVMLGDPLHIPILYNHGNNDSTQENYGPFTSINYKTVPKEAGWVDENNNPSPYHSSGFKCKNSLYYPCIHSETPNGYYSVYLQNKLKLISLDSIMFTGKSQGNYSAYDAETQFQWFAQQMRESYAAQDSVIFAMHVAPTVWSINFDPATTSKHRFENIIADYPGIAIGMFTGHSHYDDTYKYTVKSNSGGKSQTFPRINVAGLSTSHGNAPAFKDVTMVKINGKWAIKDFATYAFRPAATNSVSAFLNDSDIKLEKFYSFNITYCPKENQSTVTLSQCQNAKGVTSSVLDRLSTAGNPNCIEYTGGRCIKEGQ